MSSDGTERLRPQCFNPNCNKSFESVNEMVAVPGRGGCSPRHFCESCAERIRRGPPIRTDGGSTNGTERNGTAVICQDCPYQDVWHPVRTEREKCKHDLVHESHTVEYTDPDELSKVVTMDGEVVKRLDEQAELVTDGGTEQRDPTEDSAACSKCGVHIGAFGGDYCDGCAREIGAKPPLERCMHCGQRAPQNHMESVDISTEDEYYPEIRYFCPDCSGGKSA